MICSSICFPLRVPRVTPCVNLYTLRTKLKKMNKKSWPKVKPQQHSHQLEVAKHSYLRSSGCRYDAVYMFLSCLHRNVVCSTFIYLLYLRCAQVPSMIDGTASSSPDRMKIKHASSTHHFSRTASRALATTQ